MSRSLSLLSSALLALSLTLLTCAVGGARAQTTAPIVLPSLTRPTIQQRFAPRDGALALWLSGGGHIRDDYYTSYGGELALSYFFSDAWGLELRYRELWTSLSDEATTLRDRYGLVPDARPQRRGVSLGALIPLGYAKLLTGSSIVHFDPLLAAHLGVVTADERVLPTLHVSLSPTLLLRGGLKLRLDLGLTVQSEGRERGRVLTTGFLPMLGVGWGGTPSEIGARLGLSKR